jgi:hypothetical protein
MLGRLPGPHEGLGFLAAFLRRRLDRTHRSAKERLVRGMVVLVLVPPLLALAGWLVMPYLYANGVTAAAAAFALALMMRQRPAWDRIMAQGRSGKDTAPTDGDFIRNRQAARALVLAYTDRGIVSLLLFCLGGFALLLPYRFLRAAIDDAAPGGALAPESPYCRPFLPLAGLLALPGTLVAGMLLAAAHVFIPGTNLMAVRGLAFWRRAPEPDTQKARGSHGKDGPQRAHWAQPPAEKGPMLVRLVPLGVVAHGLGLSFQLNRGPAARRWIGPAQGTARLSTAHMRRTGLIVLVAWLLAFLVASLLAGFALTGWHL